MGDPLHPRSLHARLAVWMAASTLLTLAAFAGLLYMLLRFDEAGEAVRPLQAEAPLAEASEQMLVAMLVAAPIALIVAVGGAVLLSRRALAPLQQIIEGARRVTTSDLRLRLALPQHRDELFELTVEMNALLARLDAGFSALARYAGDASHELRTPLAVVVSTLEVALRHPRSAHEWEQTAASALGDLRRLAALVESLLALARAEGPLEQVTEVDLVEQVDLVLATLAERASARGVELSSVAEGDPADALVLGDPDALASAIRNVIDNALRHTPSGGVVRVSLHVGPEDVSVQVDDAGPGVPSAERESIFLPLHRGSAAVAEEGVGHGLGLAIVRRILEAHRGSAEVGTSPAGGARFVLHVPRRARFREATAHALR